MFRGTFWLWGKRTFLKRVLPLRKVSIFVFFTKHAPCEVRRLWLVVITIGLKLFPLSTRLLIFSNWFFVVKLCYICRCISYLFSRPFIFYISSTWWVLFHARDSHRDWPLIFLVLIKNLVHFVSLTWFGVFSFQLELWCLLLLMSVCCGVWSHTSHWICSFLRRFLLLLLFLLKQVFHRLWLLPFFAAFYRFVIADRRWVVWGRRTTLIWQFRDLDAAEGFFIRSESIFL